VRTAMDIHPTPNRGKCWSVGSAPSLPCDLFTDRIWSSVGGGPKGKVCQSVQTGETSTYPFPFRGSSRTAYSV
jgi:hypothetical protein